MNIDISGLSERQIALIHKMLEGSKRRKPPAVLINLVAKENAELFLINWGMRPKDATMMNRTGTMYYKYAYSQTAHELVWWHRDTWQVPSFKVNQVELVHIGEDENEY